MGQHDDYGSNKFPPIPGKKATPGFHPDTPPWAIAYFKQVECLLGDLVMAAIDDLKSAIAGLIAESSADITQLITQINAAGSQDPAITALTAQVTSATAALHSGFTAATGVPIPPVTSGGTATGA